MAGTNLIPKEASPLTSLLQASPLIFGSGGSTTKTTGGTTTSTVKNLPDNIIASLSGNINNSAFSKQQAIVDSQDAVDANIKKILNSNLPGIAASTKASGMYDDTTTKALTNQLVADAASSGAAVQMQAINDYAATQNAQNATAGQVLKGSVVNTTTKTAPTTQIMESTPGLTGSSFGNVAVLAGSMLLPSLLSSKDGSLGATLTKGLSGIGDVLSGLASDNCFITTAVCRLLDLPDDCEQLTVLRAFRDTYMQTSAELRNQVKEYYAVAPDLVSFISALPEQVQRDLYTYYLEEYIQPAVTFIGLGDNESALALYSEMVREATTVVQTYMLEVPDAVDQYGEYDETADSEDY